MEAKEARFEILALILFVALVALALIVAVLTTRGSGSDNGAQYTAPSPSGWIGAWPNEQYRFALTGARIVPCVASDQRVGQSLPSLCLFAEGGNITEVNVVGATPPAATPTPVTPAP